MTGFKINTFNGAQLKEVNIKTFTQRFKGSVADECRVLSMSLEDHHSPAANTLTAIAVTVSRAGSPAPRPLELQ